MELNKIFILGAGLMGSGIAQDAISKGFNVVVSDINEEFVQKCTRTIDSQLERMVSKGRMKPEDKSAAIGRLKTTVELSEAKNADVVIEAITENLELKKKAFAELDKICPPSTILASNSSSLSITAIGGATKRPDRVIGMHFLSPVPVMPICDVVVGFATSNETVKAIAELAKRLGKKVLMWKDCPGHGYTLPGNAYWNEAVYTLYEEAGTKEDIDKCHRAGLGLAMGPFEVLDFIGIDTMVEIYQYLYSSYGETKFFPCPLLTQMVEGGYYGVKTKKGFYEHK